MTGKIRKQIETRTREELSGRLDSLFEYLESRQARSVDLKPEQLPVAEQIDRPMNDPPAPRWMPAASLGRNSPKKGTAAPGMNAAVTEPGTFVPRQSSHRTSRTDPSHTLS
jgi:hypothetical protein